MNTVREEEESKPTLLAEDEEDVKKPRSPLLVPQPRSSPTIVELPSSHNVSKLATVSTPKEKDDKHDRSNGRRPSTLEVVWHAIRKPSITIDAIHNMRRGSHSRRGSLTQPRSETGLKLSGTRNDSHGNINVSLQRLNKLGTLETSIVRKYSSPEQAVDIRRSSGMIVIHPDQMTPNQRRYIMGVLHRNGSEHSLPSEHFITEIKPPKVKQREKRCKDGDENFITCLSALYAKLLFVLGIAFPVTEVISHKVPTHFYQGFYLYLYLGSFIFMTLTSATLLKDKAIFKMIKSSFEEHEEGELEKFETMLKNRKARKLNRYGSFYLRLGAVAFGVGSMVYSGLEFGQYFELKNDEDCSNLLQAVTPIARMVLTLAQMQFIFLDSRVESVKYKGLTRFGLMHMIATNMCEWLYVIVEETKHEIIHLSHADHADHHSDDDKHDLDKRGTNIHDYFECHRTNVMGSLVQNASPFLFPCTIEYSLICAVILYEMWKSIRYKSKCGQEKKHSSSSSDHRHDNGVRKTCDGNNDHRHQQQQQEEEEHKSSHHFSVDCSNAHRGLFCGILVLVLTIISLIVFAVMTKDKEYYYMSVYVINSCEMILHLLTVLAIVIGSYQMRYLKYSLCGRESMLNLDNTLLVWAQTGVFIYGMFSIISAYFMLDHSAPDGIIPELISLIQVICQTVFILDATCRQTTTLQQYKNKPARQIITFLLVSNMAMWLINTLQKNRAEFRPTHLEFYGIWAWTIITHVSMPLAIFYRFHSTICLFEIWKDCYKFKSPEQTRVKE